MLLTELARTLGASLVPSTAEGAGGDREITGIAPLSQATADQISFLTNPKYASQLRETRAAAVILAEPVADIKIAQLVHRQPYAAMAKAAQLFWAGPKHHAQGHSALASVHPSAEVHPSATLYPYCHVDADARVGEQAVLYPGVYIGGSATVGARSVLYPSVTVMHDCHIGADVVVHAGSVIGGDGFGFAPTKDGIEKIPQIGAVRIGDHCEIGALCTIDRGALTDTVLAHGCKLDSQVHVAHGVDIGEFGMICAQAGIAGSTKIGKRLVMAGHSAIGPALEIGDHVVLGPKCGMTRSTEDAGEYLGMPAVPARDWRRQVVAIKDLPDLVRKVNAMAHRLEHLEAALADRGK